MGKFALEKYRAERDARTVAKRPHRPRKGPNTFKRKWGMTKGMILRKDGQSQDWVQVGTLNKLKPRAKRTKAKQRSYLAKCALALERAHKRLMHYEAANSDEDERLISLFDECMAARNTMPESMMGVSGYALGWQHDHGMNWSSFDADWHYDKSGKAWVGPFGAYPGPELPLVQRPRLAREWRNWSMDYERGMD